MISIKNLSKYYADLPAVNNISCEFETGKTTALLGGNGAGKTTTIFMMLGVLKPNSGEIYINNIDMLKNRYDALPFTNFQSPYVELPHRLTVFENMYVNAQLYNVPDAHKRIDQLLEDLDLMRFKNQPSGALSAGQKTRLALAKALINTPTVLFLDEPTASIDPDTGDRIRSYLEFYQQENKATIILASHNMAEVERLADHVLMMKKGSILDQSSPKNLLQKYDMKNLEDVFIDLARS